MLALKILLSLSIKEKPCPNWIPILNWNEWAENISYKAGERIFVKNIPSTLHVKGSKDL